MIRGEIREHWAEIVRAVFVAEDNVRPTLSERKNTLGDNPTKEQKDVLADEWCLAVADEMLNKMSDKELKELYG